MSSQYHLIMMSSRISFAMSLVERTLVWFSSVLAWGAMSWKAIRSIKRSNRMVWAAAVCTSLHGDTRRVIQPARERALDRLSQLLADTVALWSRAQDICPVNLQRWSKYLTSWQGYCCVINVNVEARETISPQQVGVAGKLRNIRHHGYRYMH